MGFSEVSSCGARQQVIGSYVIRGEIYIIKSQAGEGDKWGTIKLSVREHVRDQKMEPANEMYSIKKCLGEWRGPRRFHRALHQQASVTRKAQPETAKRGRGVMGGKAPPCDTLLMAGSFGNRVPHTN